MLNATKKSISILASDSRVKDYLAYSITEVIGHLVNVKSYAMDEEFDFPIQSDLVVTTGKFLKDKAKEIFPNSKIIVGKRVITGYNLEKILTLPKGSRALIISNPKELSEEIESILHDYGINHIDCDYFWKGKNVDWNLVDVVITPGMPHLCDNIFKEIIDIGNRALSVKTFAEILSYFSLDFDYLEIFENKYIRLHIDTCSKVSLSLKESEKLRANQDTILHTIEEGIIQVNQDNEVLIINPSAKKFFDISTDSTLPSEFAALFEKFDKIANSEDCNPDYLVNLNSLVFNYNESQYLCTINVITLGNESLKLYSFKQITKIQELEKNIRRKLYDNGFTAKYTFDDIWGKNLRINNMKELSSRFAKTELSILIIGESGTGKEILAQSIHNLSPRSNGPFVGVNFGAIPENLLESELFGHTEGSFTGARKNGKKGLFEIAHGGTIFLDEIGDASPRSQTILLRALEERLITPIGSEKSIPIDVRVISATNKPLEDMVSDGTFRNDLYYRLGILPINTIPLRDMKEELYEFISKITIKSFNSTKDVEPRVIDVLSNYDWPGNFRELKNVVNYMHYASMGVNTVSLNHLPDYLFKKLILSKFISSNIDTINIMEMIQNNPILYDILTIFDSVSPSSIGRYKINRMLNNQNSSITDADVRKYLTVLEDANLITTGKTRQGSALTEYGEYVVSYANYYITNQS